MKKWKKMRQSLILAGIITPGIIISILGLYYVSQQKTSRELNLKKEYELRANEILQNIESGAEQSISKVFTELSGLNIEISDPSSIIETIKSLVVNNPIIRYPFILEESGVYIFPVAGRKTKSRLRSPDLAISDPVAGSLYSKGRELEFNGNDIPEALQIYMKCLRISPGNRATPYIINAIARCYFKEKKFHQASYYYQLLIKDQNNKLKNDLPFWLTILRQEALSQKNLGLMQSSLKRYLSLYEKIVKHESLSGPGQFEMYKNEALDHLSRYREVLKDSDISQFSSANLSELRNITDLDRILDWRFTESPEEASDIRRDESTSEERFLKLKELNTPSDEKTWFYRTIRSKIDLGSVNDEINFKSFLFFPVNKFVDIRYKRFRTSSGDNDYIFGFLVSDDHIKETFFSKEEELKLSVDNTKPKIEYNTDINLTEVKDNDRIILLNLPFIKVLNGYSLILYSGDPNHFQTIARKEVWINYGLIISLITFLILGTILFYKYMAKEMELLRSKAEFIDHVSHTLKTPITRMRLLAENITSGWIDDTNKRDEFLKSIISETKGMNETINNMLDFSQIDSGKKLYKFRKVSVKEIIEEYLKNNSDDLGPGIKTELKNGLPELNGDPDGIMLIISNLLQNSMKYSPGKKDILIKLTQEGECIRLEIKDKGIGISSVDKKRIFEKFYRSGIDKVTAMEGSGLGLFIVAHIVAAHKGEITVNSRTGEGSSFVILFPINDTMGK